MMIQTAGMIVLILFERYHFNARRGAKHLETADILPNCVQGGVQSATSPLPIGCLIGTKFGLKCKKSLDFKRFFLYQLYC